MGLTRRAALKGLIATGVGAFAGAGIYGGAYERHQLRTITATLPVSGLPLSFNGFRVGVLTDIHHSAFVSSEAVTRAVTLVMSEAPDLIVLGGDYVTYGDRRFVEPVAELLAPLASPNGVFAILGNHDDDREVPAALSRRRIEVLKDQRTRLTRGGEGIELAGIRFWTRRAGEIARVLRGSSDPALLLAHDPRRLIECAALNVPAMLSGHTHGGQLALPPVDAIVRRRFPVVAGLGERENTTIFVSRGIGTVTVPMRINCPPEVNIITLGRRANM
jgi:hypothetical protein